MQLPLSSWSLKKLLLTESGSFERAKLKILYTFLILSMVKVAIVIVICLLNQQIFNLGRAGITFVVYSVAFKLLLSDKKFALSITHTMIVTGILIIWSNIFLAAQSVSIVSLQFIFMTIVSSFYLLDKRFGLIYSVLASLPVILYMLIPGLKFQMNAEPLAAPGPLIISLLNFVTLIVAHYLYHEAFSRNLTEKENLNRQLKVSVKKAQHEAQVKSEFLSTMSHELRTPLNTVIGISDLLLDEVTDEMQRENIKVLNFSAHNLQTLVNDILDFNKLDSGKLKLEAIGVNLAELLYNIGASLELQAKEKGLQFVLEIDKLLKMQNVITDPIRISQIVYNLAGNGIKFTHKGTVWLKAKCLATDTENLKVCFTIADTGIGIGEDKLEQIFEPFVQESTSTTRNYGGTGLGLPIVKRLLTLFGSEMRLTSKPGSGSEFYFEITFKQDAKRTAERPEAKSIGNLENLSGLRMLVAEDNQMNIFLIKKLCSKWSIDVTIAETGKEALFHMNDKFFDVVLMDLHMPEMDGYEATMHIRRMTDAAKSNIPIIALTAASGADTSERIKDAGMNDYMYKPFNSNELFNKLKGIHQNTLVTETGLRYATAG